MFIINFLSLFLISTNIQSQVSVLENCFSVEKKEIKYFEKKARESGLKKRILIFAQIHGDEPQAGELAEAWIHRLEKIEPSNSWRIIPLLNPDGLVKKTRFNSNGVDLNRNFPTKDWEANAKIRWEKNEKSDPRRFPGNFGGSEPEVKCAIAHVEEFKPDLIVSIHTPYGMFDFDGPLNKKLNTQHLLPWRRLGTFPGSMGRYMWDERKIPVLTIELKEYSLIKNKKGFVEFQDLLSDLIP